MKKNIFNKFSIIISFIVFLSLFSFLAYALDECKGTMLINEVPCIVLISSNDCTTVGIKFYNNGSTLLDDRSMTQYSPFTCNQTFNYTNLGTYTFNYSTGDSGSIVVEEDENQQYYLYVVTFIIFFILLWIDYKVEEGIFTMIAGMLAMIIGINLYVSGFPNLVNDFLRVSIALPFWGVGAYLILAPAMKFFEEWKDKE